MNETMEYKGYRGSVEFSDVDKLFYGKVLDIKALVSYEGADVATLQSDFRAAVDDYMNIVSPVMTKLPSKQMPKSSFVPMSATG